MQKRVHKIARKVLMMTLAAAALLTTTAAAADVGTVDASALRLRQSASTSSEVLTLIPTEPPSPWWARRATGTRPATAALPGMYIRTM